MRTVKINLNEDLLETMDAVIKDLKTNRSSFTRDALRNAIAQHKIQCQEERHRNGYEKHPVQKAEFGVWKSEHDWGDK
jgi:metal-responsive CopG/Arc/MetJ family transcriptional regulator